MSENHPPLLVVSGGQTLLRRRFLSHLKRTQQAEGWFVEGVDGADPLAIRDVISGGLFVQQKTLAIVHNPNKVDLDVLVKHHESKASNVTLLLHIEGDPDGRTKFGKFVRKLGSVHKAFPMPKEWDAPKVAVNFIQAEVEIHGMTLRPALASALVSRVGSDLGMLAFEIEKMVLLAQAAGVTVIDAPEIKGAMAPIAEASVASIVDALGGRNQKQLSKALTQLRRTSKADPTMRVCRLLGASVTRWVEAVHLDNLPPKAAATELGLNPWYYENKVLPSARRWGKTGTSRLVADIAASERAVLSGAMSPWAVLTARLLAACAR